MKVGEGPEPQLPRAVPAPPGCAADLSLCRVRMLPVPSAPSLFFKMVLKLKEIVPWYYERGISLTWIINPSAGCAVCLTAW